MRYGRRIDSEPVAEQGPSASTKCALSCRTDTMPSNSRDRHGCLVAFCTKGVGRTASASQGAVTAAINLASASVPAVHTDDAYIQALSSPGSTNEETASRIAIPTSLSGIYGHQQSNYVSGLIASLAGLVGVIGLTLSRLGLAVRTAREISS